MIGLSQSSVNVFRECPRCFWMDKVRKVKRPRGIFPSLPKGIDRVMKQYVEDNFMDEVVYVGLAGQKPYPDRRRLETMRNWRTFQAVLLLNGLSVKVWGELDDLLLHPDGKVSPWDFKSKDSLPTDASAYSEQYYQTQADIYDVLLSQHMFETTGHAYFTYVAPERIEANGSGHMIHFQHMTGRIDTDRKRAEDVLYRAAKCLEGPMPEAGEECEYCDYMAQARKEQVLV